MGGEGIIKETTLTQLKLLNKETKPDIYQAALQFVQTIDTNLENGLHYQDSQGNALTTLDQVMLAIEHNRWPNTLVTHQQAA